MDDQQFRLLLHRFRLAWHGYRKVRKGVKKRIRRHMQQLGCHNVEEYFLILDRDQESRLQCERLMTVSISRFYRDRGLWQTLEYQLLSGIIEKSKDRVKVWSAGCACGEEVYSLKFLWNSLRDCFGYLPDLEILATDMNPVYLDKARAGIFSRSSLKDVPENIKTKYFSHKKGKNLYEVVPSSKEDITWRVHHLLDDPPPEEFHIIFLRNNLLTYYTDELRVPAFRKVVDRLLPGGILLIGSHEKLPLETPNLMPLGRHPYVFQRQEQMG